MALEPGFSDKSFFLNGMLIDTEMLNYEVQRSGGNNAKGHRRLQAVAKLRILASELANGYGSPYGEEVIQQWVKDCSK